MESVLSYKMKDDIFIVYKNESCYVQKDGIETYYKSLKEYENDAGYVLEDLYPSNLILLAKFNLKWSLHLNGNTYYEVRPYKSKIVYRLDSGKRVECSLPKGTKKVSWSEHPYRVLL